MIYLLIWAYVSIFGIAIVCLTTLIFHYKESERIISLLPEAGFVDLANRLFDVVSTIGKIRPYNSFSNEGKIWDSVWDDFLKIKIPKIFKSLFRLQLLAKSIYLFSIIIKVIFFSLPAFIVCYGIIYSLRKL